MKKFICAALWFVLLLSMVYVSPLGIQTVNAEPVYYNVTGGQIKFALTTGSIIGYTGSPTNVVIPSTIYGASVTSIGSFGNSGFKDCTSLTSVTIPNSVTSIGNYAFYGCTNLTNISIPNSVTCIGSRVFSYCCSLTSVTIPNSVTYITDFAFYYCTSLTSVIIGNGVISIYDYAFGGCNSLTSVYFCGNAPLMGGGVFANTASGFKIYYISGSTGFTTPLWQGYPAEIYSLTPPTPTPIPTAIPTPAPTPYVINNIGYSYYSPQNKTISATVNITKVAANSNPMNLLLCFYDNIGRLKGVTTFVRSLNINDTINFSSDFDVPLDCTGYYIKAFIFDGFNTLRPLAVNKKCILQKP